MVRRAGLFTSLGHPRIGECGRRSAAVVSHGMGLLPKRINVNASLADPGTAAWCELGLR
jgi:hypothetical protein